MPIISIAPMLDWTDRHYRYFMRQITKKTVLYTEMIVADAIIHGNQNRLLSYNDEEHKVVLQLGGSDPEKLAKASVIGAQYGYDEINLNVGCPSDRVKSGNFGACLMADPHLVAACIKSMQDRVSVPVTVKHRIGLDHNNEYGFVGEFVGVIANAGCKHFIVHARNAILKGLSPKENREIPPLKYEYVYRLKKDFPDITFTINGGIKTISEIEQHQQFIDGVMLGREAYYNPYLFINMDMLVEPNENIIKPSRLEIATQMLSYLEEMKKKDIPLHHVTRHMIGLYYGCANAKMWRTTLANEMIKENSLFVYENLLKTIETMR